MRKLLLVTASLLVFCAVARSSTNSFDWKDKVLSATDTRQYAYTNYIVSAESPMVQVFSNQEWIKPPVRYIQMAAATNEYESVQIVIKPLIKGLRKVHIEVSDLVNIEASEYKISSEHIRCRPVGYVYCKLGQTYNPSGWYPDVLLNRSEYDIKPEETAHPFWLTVYVPPGTQAGGYRGTITVHAADVHSVEIPLILKVWDFEIPVTQHLPTDFALRPNLLGAFFGDTRGECPNWPEYVSPEAYRQWVEFFLKYRITPQPYDENVPWDEETGQPQRLGFHTRIPFLDCRWEQDDLVIDWTEADKTWQMMVDHGASVIRTAFLGGTNMTSDSPARRFYEQFLPQLRTHLQEKGWLDKAYVYGRDEPPPNLYDLVITQADAVHRLAPGIEFMIPYQSQIGFPEELCGHIDIWCPTFGAYDEQMAYERKEKGEKVWAYTGVCGVTRPNLYIYEQHIMHRLIPWMCMQQDIQGFLLYGLVTWPPPYWGDATLDDVSPDGDILPSWAAGTGGGRLAYPGGQKVTDEPQPSIRLENLRDGMEDYEYLFMLQNMVAQADSQGVHHRLVEEARGLCYVPACLAQGTGSYIPNARVLATQRNAMGHMIEQLRQSMVLEMGQ